MSDDSLSGPIKANNGVSYYPVKTKSGEEIYLDTDTLDTWCSVSRAAAANGIPFTSVFGIDHNIPPEVEAETYRRKCKLRVIEQIATKGPNWIPLEDKEVYAIIKDGLTEKFMTALDNDPNIATKVIAAANGAKAIHSAAYFAPALDILKVLLAREDNAKLVDEETFMGRTPLAYAIAGNNAPAVRILLRDKRCVQREFPRSKISPFPPYIEGYPLPESSISALKEIYDLLPETHVMWDTRWVAFFAKTDQSSAAPAAATMDPISQESHLMEVDETCTICMNAPATTIAIPCHHKVVCSKCSAELKNTPNAIKCIVCRTPIECVFDESHDAMQQ